MKRFYDSSYTLPTPPQGKGPTTTHSEREGTRKLHRAQSQQSQLRASQHINLRDYSPKTCIKANNFGSLKVSLVNEQSEKNETKQVYKINNFLINKHNHVNYRLANQVEKHKTISSEKQAHFEVLCSQTVEVQRQIEVAKNEIAQIMDLNEKKLEVIQKQQDLVQSMKEDIDEVQDNT